MASPRSKSLLSGVRRREETESPGQERKRFDSGGGSGNSDIIATMKTLLTQDQTKRDQQHTQLVSSFDQLRNTVTVLQSSIETEKTTREQEIKVITERLNTIEQQDHTNIQDMVKSEVSKAMTSHGGSSANANEVEERERQVIAKGFDFDTDADQIISTIEEFLSSASRRDKVANVSTFTDPSSIGVITFKTIAAKIGFFRKIRNHNTKLNNDRFLKFEDNDTWEQRVRKKTLGQIKHKLHEKCEHALKDIMIDRTHGTVKIKGVKAAKVGGDGEVEYEDTAAPIKTEVNEYMANWVAKRTRPQ
jgi:hypothetical protein